MIENFEVIIFLLINIIDIKKIKSLIAQRVCSIYIEIKNYQANDETMLILMFYWKSYCQMPFLL